jgi:hypothetical protein
MFPVRHQEKIMKRGFLLVLAVVAVCPSHGNASVLWECLHGPAGYVQTIAVMDSFQFAGTTINAFRASSNHTAWNEMKIGGTKQGVNAFVVKGTKLFAGTNNGVYVSSDTGKTWTQSNDGLELTTVMTMYVYASKVFTTIYGKGVYVSDNDGLNWQPAETGLSNTYVWALAGKDLVLLAGTGDGIYRSVDTAKTWAKVVTLDEVRSLAASDSGFYAGTNATILRSPINDGVHWTSAGAGYPYNQRVFALLVQGSSLFAASQESGIYRSPLMSVPSWSQVNTGLPVVTVYCLAANGPALLSGTEGGIYQSPDNGDHWTARNQGVTGAQIMELASSGMQLFACTDLSGAQVYRSGDDGATWIPKRKNLPVWNQIDHIAAYGAVVYAGSQYGVHRSADTGNTWTLSSNGLPSYSTPRLALNGTTAFAATTNGSGVYTASIGGGSWNAANSGLTRTGAQQISAIVTSETEALIATNDGVYRSVNNGGTWTRIENDSLSATATLVLSGATVFAGGNGVFVSTDTGKTWVRRSNGLPQYFGVTSMASGGGKVFATDGTSLFFAQDNGTNWFQIDQGLDSSYIKSLLVVGPFLYVGTDDDGVWRVTLESTTIRSALRSAASSTKTSVLRRSVDLRGRSAFTAMPVYDIRGCRISVAAHRPAASVRISPVRTAR